MKEARPRVNGRAHGGQRERPAEWAGRTPGDSPCPRARGKAVETAIEADLEGYYDAAGDVGVELAHGCGACDET